LPKEETTPPVTNMNLLIGASVRRNGIIRIRIPS
jgi:hypothetical protein